MNVVHITEGMDTPKLGIRWKNIAFLLFSQPGVSVTLVYKYLQQLGILGTVERHGDCTFEMMLQKDCGRYCEETHGDYF